MAQKANASINKKENIFFGENAIGNIKSKDSFKKYLSATVSNQNLHANIPKSK